MFTTKFCLNCHNPINATEDYIKCKCKVPNYTRLEYPLKRKYLRKKIPDYTEYKTKLFGLKQEDYDYWIKKGKIPIGTFHHPYSYEDWDNIPEDEICFIRFQPVSIDLTKREAFNILYLGKSGDGKSKSIKQIWYHLARAGFWIVYIEPKGFASGRAKVKWSEPNHFKSPHTKFDGIPLSKYVPNWVKDSCINRVNNKKNGYKTYDIKLNWMTDILMWESLGIGSGASKIVQIIKNYNDNRKIITIETLKRLIRALDKEEIHPNARNDILGKIERIESIGLLGNQKLDFMNEFEKGKSVCIDYNLSDNIYMAFDIGMMIKRLSKINDSLPLDKRRPIMAILDDGSIYLQRLSNGRYNYAMKETEYIGNNYRSQGVNNICAVQSLNVIEPSVADTYKYKIITPLFPNINQLSNINIPYRAIELLKLQYLTIEPNEHIMEYLLVNDKNEVVHFFPFTPPCEHFKEVDEIDNSIFTDDFD